MNFKKVTVKTEESIIKRTTQTTEIDFDFTQVYDCMYSLSFSISSPITFQLLFFLLRKVDTDNTVDIGRNLFKEFNKEKVAHGFKSASEPALYKCLKELVRSKVVSKLASGKYFINPYILWKDDKESRLSFIKEETRSPSGLMFNPFENMKYLSEPDADYKIVE